MLAKQTKLFSLLVFLSLFVSFLSPSYAAETNNSGSFVQVASETAIVKQSGTNASVAELTKGMTLKVVKTEGGNVYFQWAKGLAYIAASDVAPTAVAADSYSYTSDTPYLQIREKVTIQSPTGNSTGVLFPGQYPLFQEQERVWQIIVGNQLANIPKTDAAIILSKLANTNQANSTETSGTTKLTIAATAQSTAFTATVKYFQVTVDQLPVYDNSTGKLVQVGTLEKGQVFPRIKDAGNWHQIQYGNHVAYVLKRSTIPASGKNIKTGTQPKQIATTVTTIADAPVYDNSTGSLVKMATIQKGRAYPIIQKDGNWYKLVIAGRIGYIHKNVARMNFKPSDRFFSVLDDQLPVYDNSTGKLVQVGTLEKGQVFPRVKDIGNWHQMKFGKGYGFVWKLSTEPASSSSVKNINSLAPSAQSFTTIVDAAVYDNSSGKLVKFATIKKGVQYPITKDSGNWYIIDVGGRTGYIQKNDVKLPFTKEHRYFETIDERVPIYDNSSGKLTIVAYLSKGQVFPRLRDFGDWHEVTYGKGVGYVWKESTRPPFQMNLKNENKGLKPINQSFSTLAEVPVYDYSTGIVFATLIEGETYPLIREEDNAVVIDLAGRIGYVLKDNIQVGPIIRYSQYNLTLNDMLAIQMTKNPQTDLYRNNKSYVHSAYIQLDPNDPTKGTVTATSLNVREGAGETYWIVGTLKQGTSVTIKAKEGDWYEIQYGPWKNAKQEDVLPYLDPSRFSRDSKEYFQFLVLSERAKVPVDDINTKILADKGILAGKGQAFIDAANLYHINEIYLISHALLETGNGTSALATGVVVSQVDGQPVEPKTVYNMYGIAAYDSCPITCGAEYAYKQGWFTPEAAIIGGAQYIASKYINNPTYKQDTLYKMRWNPDNPGTHQYATDIGWAVKQVTNIKRLYDLLDRYTLIFDIPVYLSSK